MSVNLGRNGTSVVRYLIKMKVGKILSGECREATVSSKRCQQTRFSQYNGGVVWNSLKESGAYFIENSASLSNCTTTKASTSHYLKWMLAGRLDGWLVLSFICSLKRS